LNSTPIRIHHLLLSYPLGTRSVLTLFHTSHYTSTLKALIQDKESDVLVVYGGRDEFTGVNAYDRWQKELEGYTRESPGKESGTLRVCKVEDGTHFWFGRSGEELERVVGEWVP
jgi:uncharacterized protein